MCSTPRGHRANVCKSKPASSTGASLSGEMGAAPPSTLLSLPVINSFLTAAVSVARSQQQEGSDEEAELAAQAGVQVAAGLFTQQLVAVSSTVAGAKAVLASATPILAPDAISWASLIQLYGVLGSWQQVTNIVRTAVKQQLPGVQPDGLQAVLAGAAAAYNAAGQHMAAVQLLDELLNNGVRSVTDAKLAQQLEVAAEADEQAWENLMAAGWW